MFMVMNESATGGGGKDAGIQGGKFVGNFTQLNAP